MIIYEDGTQEMEEEDFISKEEWEHYNDNQDIPGAVFRVKPDFFINRKKLNVEEE